MIVKLKCSLIGSIFICKVYTSVAPGITFVLQYVNHSATRTVYVSAQLTTESEFTNKHKASITGEVLCSNVVPVLNESRLEYGIKSL